MKRAKTAYFVLVFAFFSPGPARAQTGPVRLSLKTVFQDDTFEASGYVGFDATLENRSASPLRGELTIAPHTSDAPLSAHSVHVDLPPHATRRARVTMLVSSADAVRARYDVGGVPIARAEIAQGYWNDPAMVVLLLRAPRIRGSLADIRYTETGYGSGGRIVETKVLTAATDARSGDPILPEDAVAYGSIRLLIAHSDLLLRLDATERDALLTWARAGGLILVFPRSERDLRDPFLATLLGEIASDAPASSPAPSPFVPAEVADRPRLRCGADASSEPFGCSHPIGFGTAYVTFFDGNDPAVARSEAVHAMVVSILGQPNTPGIHRSAIALGSGNEGNVEMNSVPWFGFGPIQQALEPNLHTGFALLAGFAILLLYTIFVGPLNFRWVRKKNQPLRAFVTTPAMSATALALMLALGAFHRGVIPRYRRVAIAEAVEGDAMAVQRRWTGLRFSWPDSVDLDAPRSTAIATVSGSGTNTPPIVEHRGDRTTLRGIRGSLWETLFVREEAQVDLGGDVEFVRENGQIRSIVNRTRFALRGAFFVDEAGQIHTIGDVRPGGTHALSGERGDIASGAYQDTTVIYAGSGDDDRIFLKSVLGAAGAYITDQTGAASLFARIDPERGGSIAGFQREADVRFLRVAPRRNFTALAPVHEDPANSNPQVTP